jgi:hypothetical protein
VALVREMNHAIAWDEHTDVITLDFLEATTAVVAKGTVYTPLRSLWASHLGHLLQQTATWELATSQIAERYLAGHSPLFAAATAHLASVRSRCETLATIGSQQPRRRGRMALGVDRAAIASAAGAEAPDLVARLLAGARAEVELVFGARPGLIYVQERIAATKLAPDHAQ